MSEFRSIPPTPRELLERHIADKNRPNPEPDKTGRTVSETGRQKSTLAAEREGYRHGSMAIQQPSANLTSARNNQHIAKANEQRQEQRQDTHETRKALENYIEKTQTTSANRAAPGDYGELKKAHREVQQENLTRKPGIDR